MTNSMTRRGVLAAAFATLVLSGDLANAREKPVETLELKTARSRDIIIDGARRIRLTVNLDDKVNGWGSLSFDPNIETEWGTTEIDFHDIPVRVRLVRDNQPTAKGRRLHELRRTDLEYNIDGPRPHWYLAVPMKKGAPCTLTFVDKDGKMQDVVVLE